MPLLFRAGLRYGEGTPPARSTVVGQMQYNGDDDDEAINDGGDDINDCFHKIFGEMQ